MIPDAEAVITRHLNTALTALAVKVRGRTPGNTVDPWVRLTLLDAPATDGSVTDHLVAAYVQLDCFAGKVPDADSPQEDASLIARTARAALATIADSDHEGATVTGCRIDGYTRLPDTEFEPARERYVLTATVWMHG